MERAKSQLPPQRWKVILIITDTPGPGETYLGENQIKAEIEPLSDGLVDGAGLSLELGSFEKIAK